MLYTLHACTCTHAVIDAPSRHYYWPLSEPVLSIILIVRFSSVLESVLLFTCDEVRVLERSCHQINDIIEIVQCVFNIVAHFSLTAW